MLPERSERSAQAVCFMWYMVIVYAVYDVFTDDVGVAYQEAQHGNSDLWD